MTKIFQQNRHKIYIFLHNCELDIIKKGYGTLIHISFHLNVIVLSNYLFNGVCGYLVFFGYLHIAAIRSEFKNASDI